MEKIKRFSVTLCLILFLLTLAITITINSSWLYSLDVDKLGILDYVTVSKPDLMKNYHELMNYLNYFWINPLKMTDFPVSESGALHFYEVKRLFQLNYAVLILTVVPATMFIRQSVKTGTLWLLIKLFSYILAGLFALIIFMAAAFDTFFVKFHEVFFNNDAWIFDPATDPIIMALPQDYFMHCFILFFILFVLFLIVIIMFGKRQLKQLRN